VVRRILFATVAGAAAAAAVLRRRRDREEDVWGPATRVVDLR
jgi:hypothetical protein